MPEEEIEEWTPPVCITPVRSASPDLPDLDRAVDSEVTVPDTPSAFAVLALCRTGSGPPFLPARELTFEYWYWPL